MAKTKTSRAQRSERSEREARLEAMRRAQAAKERRRRLALFVGAGVVALALIATVAVVLVRQQRASDPANIGVAAAAASCDPVQPVAVDGVSQHVGPGTNAPDTTAVEYDSVPAVSGPHYVTPQYPSEPFYTEAERPAVETLVHNLEHGYTIAWYSPDLPEAEATALRAAAEAMRAEEATQSGKFIAAPWDTARGALPEGKTVALAHWGASEGALQYCGAVSGEVIADFVAAHPADDSPEPNAA